MQNAMESERRRWLDCAVIDVTMEGPRLMGWNRSALNRLWREAHGQKLDGKIVLHANAGQASVEADKD